MRPRDDDDPGDLVQGREGVEHVPVVLGNAAKAAMGVGVRRPLADRRGGRDQSPLC